LRLERPALWLGPTWALLCGTIASGGFKLETRTPVLFLVALLLVEPVFGLIWSLAAETNWGALKEALAAARPPAAMPASHSARERVWASLTAHAQAAWATVEGRRAAAWMTTAMWALALAGLFNLAVVILVVLALLLAFELGPKQTHAGTTLGWPQATLRVGLAWLIGYAAFTAKRLSPLDDLWLAVHAPALLLAVLYTVTYLGLQRTHGWATAAQIGVAVLLVALKQPLWAGLVGLALIGQLLFQPWASRAPQTDWYARRVQFLVMAAMLVSALAIA